MSSNTAIVGRLVDVQPIPDADRIKSAKVVVNGVVQATVVVGVDSQENTPVVYFTSNMCLNADTILKEYEDLGEYLGRAGRVKTVKLRKQISDGLAVEVTKFYKWEKPTFFTEGAEFTELNGTPICTRYTPPIKTQSTPSQKSGKKKQPLFNKLVEGQVRLHYDTDNLRRNAHKIGFGDIISISRKLHGTSSVTAYVQVKRKLSWIEGLLKKLGVNIVETEYDYIYTSRNVVKNANINPNVGEGYYSYDLWTDAGEKFFKGKMNKGETVYYEIVGYLPTGKEIQKGYPYGCKKNEYDIYVYRITQTDPNGAVIEYSWPMLKERCNELGVKYVTEHFYGPVKDLFVTDEEFDAGKFVDFLEKKYLCQKASDCNNKPDEGIVVKLDTLHTSVAFKLKDVAFIERETKQFEKGEEDIEEES